MQDNNQNKPQMPRKRRPDFIFGLVVILLIVGVIVFIQQLTQPKAVELTYSELKSIAEAALYDKELVYAAKIMYDKMNVRDNFAEWFLTFKS